MSLCEDLGYVDPDDTLPEFEEDSESVSRALALAAAEGMDALTAARRLHGVAERTLEALGSDCNICDRGGKETR